MNNKSYYKTLGVNPSATADEIKITYRKLAMKYHPDRNPKDKHAEERFKKINEAYEVLKDPRLRAEYDESIRPYKTYNSSNTFSDFKDKSSHIIKQTIIILIIFFSVNISTIIINSIFSFIGHSIHFFNQQNFLTTLFHFAAALAIVALLFLFFKIFISPHRQAILIKKLKNSINILGIIFFFIINLYLLGLFAFGIPRRHTHYNSNYYTSSKSLPASKPSFSRIGR